MIRAMINCVYKNNKGWFTGYVVGENWMYGIIGKDTLSSLKKVTSVDDIDNIDNYLSLADYLKEKRKYYVSYVDGKNGHEELKEEILRKFDCDKLYIKPAGTVVFPVRNTSICTNCMMECKSNSVYTCNRFTIKRNIVG